MLNTVAYLLCIHVLVGATRACCYGCDPSSATVVLALVSIHISGPSHGLFGTQVSYFCGD